VKELVIKGGRLSLTEHLQNGIAERTGNLGDRDVMLGWIRKEKLQTSKKEFLCPKESNYIIFD